MHIVENNNCIVPNPTRWFYNLSPALEPISILSVAQILTSTVTPLMSVRKVLQLGSSKLEQCQSIERLDAKLDHLFRLNSHLGLLSIEFVADVRACRTVERRQREQGGIAGDRLLILRQGTGNDEVAAAPMGESDLG